MAVMIVKISVFILTSVAAYMDITREKVSNKWLLIWFLAAVAADISGLGVCSLKEAAVGTILPVVILAVFFCLRLIGAGDIKLLCVLGAFIGAQDILFCMLLSFVFAVAAALVHGMFTHVGANEIRVKRVHVAVYIFAAAVLWIGGVY